MRILVPLLTCAQLFALANSSQLSGSHDDAFRRAIAQRRARLEALMSDSVKRRSALAYDAFRKGLLTAKPSDIKKLAGKSVDGVFGGVPPEARVLLVFCVLSDFVGDERVARIKAARGDAVRPMLKEFFGDVHSTSPSLQSRDKLGNTEIQTLMSNYNEAQTTLASIQKCLQNVKDSEISKI